MALTRQSTLIVNFMMSWRNLSSGKFTGPLWLALFFFFFFFHFGLAASLILASFLGAGTL